MNAVIGLCHFCEAHGPCPLFCTFTTEDEKHVTEASISSAQCTGCTSIGPETVYVTRSSGIIYCSRESLPNTELSAFLKQSAIRSITCEVSWSKDGGTVYFNDVRGHVLSFTFQLRDTRARGLKRWFSIIVLMKDRMLLLGLTTMFYEKMKIISKELQDLSEIVFNKEQDVCSQRALRLQTGHNDFGPSRCLPQLTGEEDIFKKLHGYFTGMLKAGDMTYTETSYTSQDLLKELDTSSMNSSIFTPNACKVDTLGCMPFRSLEGLLSKKIFRIMLYCTLTGIDILITSNNSESDIIVKTLLNLLPLPQSRRNEPKVHATTANVTPAASKCVLEEIKNGKYACRWPGTLPTKCPTLMNKIENAMDETKFDNEVLNQHIKYLQLEWLGIARAVKSAIDASGKNSEPVLKLKEVFGVNTQDDLLLNYWIKEFCI